MARVTVASVDDLSPGEGMICDAEGTEVALFNVGGKFHAIGNTCKHRGGPLGDGELNGKTVSCPWHGWEYDVTSGRCTGPDPEAQVACYKVTVEGGEVQVDIG